MIILTAKSSEEARLEGLALGANDYLVTPFCPRELVARSRAVLRRTAREGSCPRTCCWRTTGDCGSISPERLLI